MEGDGIAEQRIVGESQLKAQIAGDFINILTKALERNCFGRCIRKPGIKLEKADETCLARCMDRYLEAWSITSQTVSRIQRKIADKIHEGESQF